MIDSSTTTHNTTIVMMDGIQATSTVSASLSAFELKIKSVLEQDGLDTDMMNSAYVVWSTNAISQSTTDRCIVENEDAIKRARFLSLLPYTDQHKLR